MSRVRIVAVIVVSAGLAACGGSESGASQSATATAGSQEAGVAAERPAGAPEVEPAYQKTIDEAWQEALAGENPSMTCAALKGRTVGSEPGSADRALAACNLDIPVRYFLTYADRVESGDKTCMELMTHLLTTLPAMTISTEGFGDLARQGSADAGEAGADEADAATAGAAILAGAAAAGGGTDDPQRAIKERLRERFTEICPSETAAILR